MAPAFTTWCQKPAKPSLSASRQRCLVRYEFYLFSGRKAFHLFIPEKEKYLHQPVCLPTACSSWSSVAFIENVTWIDKKSVWCHPAVILKSSCMNEEELFVLILLALFCVITRSSTKKIRKSWASTCILCSPTPPTPSMLKSWRRCRARWVHWIFKMQPGLIESPVDFCLQLSMIVFTEMWLKIRLW